MGFRVLALAVVSLFGATSVARRISIPAGELASEGIAIGNVKVLSRLLAEHSINVEAVLGQRKYVLLYEELEEVEQILDTGMEMMLESLPKHVIGVADDKEPIIDGADALIDSLMLARKRLKAMERLLDEKDIAMVDILLKLGNHINPLGDRELDEVIENLRNSRAESKEELIGKLTQLMLVR